MQHLLVFLLVFLCLENLQADGFVPKKIIKIKKHEDEFNLIDLNQKLQNLSSNEQKALLDSSEFKKEKHYKDTDFNFAILMSFKRNFAYIFDDYFLSAEDFSKEFAKNLIPALDFKLINAKANDLYQTQQMLDKFTQKSNLIKLDIFLRKEEDKSKIYSSIVDYFLVVDLEDFYINTMKFFTKESVYAYAKINFKFISLSTGKILSAKNARLKLKLESETSMQNCLYVSSQMPLMLADALKKEAFRLKIFKNKKS